MNPVCAARFLALRAVQLESIFACNGKVLRGQQHRDSGFVLLHRQDIHVPTR